MIVKVFGKEIDTSWNHKNAEKAFRSTWCSKDSPTINFTTNGEKYRKYVQMEFNKDGSEMQKIYSWHQIPREERMHKVKKKKAREGCYFEKQSMTKIEEEEEYIMEVDYGLPSYSESETHWKKGWKEDKLPSTSGVIQETIGAPITNKEKPKRKKRWGLF